MSDTTLAHNGTNPTPAADGSTAAPKPGLIELARGAWRESVDKAQKSWARYKRNTSASWRKATLAQKAGVVALAIISMASLYICATLLLDHFRQSKYAELSDQRATVSGILPNNAKLKKLDSPLDDFVKTLLAEQAQANHIAPKLSATAKDINESSEKRYLERLTAEAERIAQSKKYHLPYIPATILKPSPIEAPPPYIPGSKEERSALATAIETGQAKTAFKVYRFADDFGIDGQLRGLTFVRLADGTTHVAYSDITRDTSQALEYLKDAGYSGKESLSEIPTSTMDPIERDNLNALALRLGTASTRAFANIKSLLLFLLNIALICAPLIFLAILMRPGAKVLKFIMPGDIKGNLDDLIGMDDIKTEVLRVQDFLNDRERYKLYGVERPANILFSGPPGTGKTKLAGYLAKALDLPILFHSAANLETGFVNGGGQTLEKALAMAKKHKRCIIFLDEAQDLFMKRGGHRKFDDDTQNMLLAILDGVKTHEDAETIWIVASNFNSTNTNQDEAMLRRFPMKVDFRLPNASERQGILAHYLSKAGTMKADNIDLEALTHFTEGSSPADLEEIVREAAMDCGSRKVLIDTSALTRASERMLIGNTDSATTEGRDAEREVIALHEAGHFLADAMRHCGQDISRIAEAKGKVRAIKISLRANARSGALGFVLRRPAASHLQTKDDIEWEIRSLYGGMANEEIFFGPQGVTTGAYSDIQQATKLLSVAVRDMGMFKTGKINLSSLDAGQTRSEINPEDRAIMEHESQRFFDEAKAMLLTAKEASRAAADILLASGEASSDEIIDALALQFGSADVVALAPPSALRPPLRVFPVPESTRNARAYESEQNSWGTGSPSGACGLGLFRDPTSIDVP